MKKNLQSQFPHRVAPYIWYDFLPTSNYGTTIKSLHTEAVSDTKSLLTRNRVLQTDSPQIAAEEANPPHPYRTTLSQHRSSFYSSIHSYHDRKGLIQAPRSCVTSMLPSLLAQSFHSSLCFWSSCLDDIISSDSFTIYNYLLPWWGVQKYTKNWIPFIKNCTIWFI